VNPAAEQQRTNSNPFKRNQTYELITIQREEKSFKKTTENKRQKFIFFLLYLINAAEMPKFYKEKRTEIKNCYVTLRALWDCGFNWHFH